MEDYISKIRTTKIKDKLYYNVRDIKRYIIDDYDIIVEKLSYYNLDSLFHSKECIEFSLFLLLLSFSNDYRTFKYKFYLSRCAVEKISEIVNPDLCIDRAKTLKYKKYGNNIFTYSDNKNSNKLLDINEIINDEINISLDVNLFRQII